MRAVEHMSPLPFHPHSLRNCRIYDGISIQEHGHEGPSQRRPESPSLRFRHTLVADVDCTRNSYSGSRRHTARELGLDASMFGLGLGGREKDDGEKAPKTRAQRAEVASVTQ